MKRFLFYWLPVLLAAGGIFYSSATPYEKQDMRPTLSYYLDHKMIANFFSSTVFQYSGEEVSVQALGPAGFVEFLIRKLAHFSVYLLLAFLLFRVLRFYFNRGKTFILSFVLTVAYAASDEIHQHFTAGRSPHVEDVMIDATGGLVGIMIAVLIYWRHFRRRKVY